MKYFVIHDKDDILKLTVIVAWDCKVEKLVKWAKKKYDLKDQRCLSDGIIAQESAVGITMKIKDFAMAIVWLQEDPIKNHMTLLHELSHSTDHIMEETGFRPHQEEIRARILEFLMDKSITAVKKPKSR